jgi:succinyldiaminopimelate transaminase
MLNPKLDRLQEYPFGRLAALIKDIEPPKGETPIIMSIGEPQMNPPAFVPQILAKEAAGWGRYPPPLGTPELRQAIAHWITRRYKLPPGTIDQNRNLFPVVGTREALFQAALVCVPQDKHGTPIVMLPNPFYQVYIGAAVMSNAEPLYLDCVAENNFLPDFDSIDEATWRRTALVYLCSPTNPQGAVASLDYIQHALELCRKHDAFLIVDECYAEIYRDREPAGGLQAAMALHAGKGDPFANLLVFHSLSKRSSAPGLRSGFVAGDVKAIELISRLRSYGGASMPQPIMVASTALWQDEEHVRNIRAHYNECFDVAQQILHNRFGFFKPDGGFFLWLDVGDSEQATRDLWGKAGVKVLPGAYVSRGEGEDNPGKRYIRVALVHDVATTRKALSRLAQVL